MALKAKRKGMMVILEEGASDNTYNSLSQTFKRLPGVETVLEVEGYDPRDVMAEIAAKQMATNMPVNGKYDA